MHSIYSWYRLQTASAGLGAQEYMSIYFWDSCGTDFPSFILSSSVIQKMCLSNLHHHHLLSSHPFNLHSQCVSQAHLDHFAQSASQSDSKSLCCGFCFSAFFSYSTHLPFQLILLSFSLIFFSVTFRFINSVFSLISRIPERFSTVCFSSF